MSSVRSGWSPKKEDWQRLSACINTHDIISVAFSECRDSCGETLDYCACERGDDFACMMLEEE